VESGPDNYLARLSLNVLGSRNACTLKSEEYAISMNQSEPVISDESTMEETVRFHRFNRDVYAQTTGLLDVYVITESSKCRLPKVFSL